MANPIPDHDPQFTDLDRTLEQNDQGDITIRRDGGAIENSLLNIFLTRKGERPHRPEFGTRLVDMKHKLMSPDFEPNVADAVRDGFSQEPRASLDKLNIIREQDQNQARIQITFTSPYLIGSQTFEIILDN